MKILQWNLENFFIFLDKYNNEDINTIKEDAWQNFSIAREKNKPLAKVFEIAEIIQKNQPDICVFCEVGGFESLQNFNKLFLNNQYNVHMTKSNSSRGIDIGFLTLKTLDFDFKVKSNKKHIIEHNGKQFKFSRDIPELRFYKNDKLEKIIFGVHLKSKISSDTDYQGIDTRQAEVVGFIQLYKRLKAKYNVPCVIAGDFNGFLQENYFEEEFKPLFQETSFKDFHDILNHSEEKRITYVRTNPYQKLQLDYILVDCDGHQQVSPDSKVIRFTTFYDIELPLPKNFEEKKQLPSDHYPQVLILK